MGTRNYVSELEYSDAKGLDTTSPENLMAQGYVRQALNVNIGSTGGYVKRAGFEPVLVTPLVGYNIRQGLEFKMSDGTTQTLLYATNNASAALLGKVVAGAITTIKSGFGFNGRPSFAQLNDSLFVFDGGNLLSGQVYEGQSSTRDMGIDAPTTAPTGVVAAGGDLEEGQYLYAYTYAFYLNDIMVAESSPSEISATIDTTSTNKTVNLTLTALPTYANANLSHLDKKIRIFRTVVNGNILFLETEIQANLTVYTSSIADAALQSEQMSLDNTKLTDYVNYDEAKYPIIARNRLLVFHPTMNRGRFSKLGFNGPLPESFPVINEFSVEGQYGSADAIVGAGQIKGVPIVLKERSIGRLEEVGLPDLGRNEDAVAYIYREISEHIGAVSHYAQTQVFDELIFLGRDNVYATDGQNVRPIARNIQETIRQCDFRGNKTYKLSTVNDTKYRRIYIQVFKDTTATEPNLTLVGDYQQYPEFRWTVYGEGENKNTHPGIRAGCFFQTEATASGGLDIYFGNTNLSGQYFKMNTGTDDNGDPIYMKIVSRPYMFGQPMIEKLYKNARIFVEAADDTYEFEFCSIYDLGSEEEFCEDFKILGVGTTWDFYEWSPGDPELIWAGPALQEKVYDPHRKAKTMQLVFKQTEADAPLTLLGWGVSGSIFSGI